jgi:hypothetical protein
VRVRRAALLAVGGVDDAFTGLYDDQVLYAKLALHGGIMRTDACVLRYRQHAESMCATRLAVADDARRAYLNWLEQYCLERADVPASLVAQIREERAALLRAATGHQTAMTRTMTRAMHACRATGGAVFRALRGVLQA